MKKIFYKCDGCKRWRINPLWKTEDGKAICYNCVTETMRRTLIGALELIRASDVYTKEVLFKLIDTNTEVVKTVTEWMKE